ncbi:hypothetical protein [Paraburkholderia hospita]|uniref:hypothetical protein n=1 Tax=Paraburkholderia hospita TaxID=169430 RepID=UPI000271DCCD|nr:hypothetical protein [Paraburkholderia hospita]EUC12648.1 hypothetical protein PMI06_008403 [Burkholderia sp. BT03]SKC46779.1 hypothetical protein SAMN06266956_0126 [Paraburkholderia hospita]
MEAFRACQVVKCVDADRKLTILQGLFREVAQFEDRAEQLARFSVDFQPIV